MNGNQRASVQETKSQESLKPEPEAENQALKDEIS